MTQALNTTDARMAGALYLAIAICGGFSIGYVPMQIVAAEAETSATNLLSQVGLYRLGLLADSAVILFELAITVLLFGMFHRHSPRLALIALLARAGMIAVMGFNLLIWVLPYLLLTESMGFDPIDAQAQSQLMLRAHDMGVFVWQLFFGTHLLALGAMILRTRLVPHLLGWGLFTGAFGYLLQGLARLTFTDIAVLEVASIALLVIVTLSELGFGVWLVLYGRTGRRQARTRVFSGS